MKVHVGGIQGVGKDTLIDLVSTTQPGIPVIHFAQRMKEIGLASSHDALLRRVDKDTRKRLRDVVFEEIESYDSCFVNGHYALPIRNVDSEAILGFEMGIPDEYVALFDSYLLIECPPESILERRRDDIARKRGNSLSNIVLELGVEKLFFNHTARSSAYSEVFKNEHLDSTAKRINDYLEKMRGGA